MRNVAGPGRSTRVARTAVFVAAALCLVLLAPALASALETSKAPLPAVAPVNTAAPALTGTPAVGKTLSCSTGTWANNPSSFSFAWLRDGAPIAGQSAGTYVVQPADQGHAISCQVTASNGGGSYTVVGLPSGSYNVGFYDDMEGGSHITQYFNGKGSYTEATPVAVSAPNVTAGVNAALSVGGRISGRVVDALTSLPIEDVFTCASNGAESGGCAMTNGNGEYTITGLPSGSYTVNFYGFFGGAYRTQAYNSQVSVVAGSTTAGIDAQLQPFDEGAQITGTVTKETGGADIEGIQVCARTDEFSICANTNAKGEYTMEGLGAGEYEVSFSDPSCSSSDCPLNYISKSEKATVTANKSTTLNQVMATGAQIAGTVSGPAGGAGVEVCAYSASSGDYVSCAFTQTNGEYTLNGLSSGEYKVQFVGSESNDYVDQYYDGKGEFGEATKVSATAPNLTSGINAQMQVGGRLTGRAIDATSHTPQENVSVCIKTEAGVYYSACRSTGANGEYEIAAIPTATYSVTFTPESESVNEMPLRRTGIGVTAGSTVSGIDAELQPGGEIVGRVTDAVTSVGLTNIEVCAEGTGEEGIERCTTTRAASPAATAKSAAVTIAGGFSQAKKPVFDAKTDDIDFFFTFSTPGKLSWSLSFKNADVGFADSLGISLGEGGVDAQAARKKAKKAKKCKRGEIKHHGKCVRVLVPFASGSENVPAGTVEVKVHADAKAVKALKSGHALHVSGTFKFQPSVGGPAVSHTESVTVKQPKKKHHRKGKKH